MFHFLRFPGHHVTHGMLQFFEQNIERLERELSELSDPIPAFDAARPGLGPDEDPTRTRYDLQLAPMGGEHERRSAQKAQLPPLAASVDARPDDATTRNTPERDRRNAQSQCNRAAVKKARAAIDDVIEVLCQGQRIAVTEQATMPREPGKAHRAPIAIGRVGGRLMQGVLSDPIRTV